MSNNTEMVKKNRSPNKQVDKLVASWKQHSCSIDHKVVERTFDWDNMKIYNPEPEKLFAATSEWIKQI